MTAVGRQHHCEELVVAAAVAVAAVAAAVAVVVAVAAAAVVVAVVAVEGCRPEWESRDEGTWHQQ
jgi:hypothetical protein